MVRILGFHYHCSGSIPAQGTKTLQDYTLQPKKKKSPKETKLKKKKKEKSLKRESFHINHHFYVFTTFIHFESTFKYPVLLFSDKPLGTSPSAILW